MEAVMEEIEKAYHPTVALAESVLAVPTLPS